MRWIKVLFTWIGGIVCVSALLSLAGMWFYQSSPYDTSRPVILKFDLSNVIFEQETKPNLLQYLHPQPKLVLSQLLKTLKIAEKDPKVMGVYLKIGELYSGMAQIQELRHALTELRQHKKFIYAYSETFGEMSSGMLQYYLASVADEIWVQPMANLNITGFSIEMPFARKLLNEWGVQPQILKREEYKTAFDSYTEFGLVPENKKALKKLLSTFFNHFIQDVALHRNIAPRDLKNIIDMAPIFDPEKALDLGLIDEIAYEDDFIDALKTEHPHSQIVSDSTYFHRHGRSSPKGDKIGVIYVTGAIKNGIEENDFFEENSDSYSENIVDFFDHALERGDLKAIILRIDSPGGSVTAAETIGHQVEIARAQGIPVIVSMGDYAASAGYWIAAPANKIVAHPTTITGSIGVIGGKIVFEKLSERLGIHWDRVSLGKNADIWSGIKPFDDSQMKTMSAMMDFTYNKFLHHVATHRHLSIDHVRQIAKGRVWSGEDAQRFGLVDELGGFDQAIRLAKIEAKIPEHGPIELIPFSSSRSVLSLLIDMMDHSEGLKAVTLYGKAFLPLKTLLKAIHYRFLSALPVVQ